MILREVSVERFTFTCTGCQHTWTVDYDIQHVKDGHGHLRDYYFRNGLPCPDPTAPGEIACPKCGRTHVIAELTARRASPAVTGPTPAHPGVPATPERTAKRARIPLLPGTPIHWSTALTPPLPATPSARHPTSTTDSVGTNPKRAHHHDLNARQL